MSFRTLRLLTVSVVGLANMSCSKSSTSITGVASVNAFNATITGGAAGTYTGIASATVAGGVQNVTLGTTDTKLALSFSRTGSKFTVGTFTLGDNLLTQYVASLSINNGASLYGSTGGTITNTSVTSTQVKATFNFQGKLNNGSTTNAVTGDFVATCALGC